MDYLEPASSAHTKPITYRSYIAWQGKADHNSLIALIFHSSLASQVICFGFTTRMIPKIMKSCTTIGLFAILTWIKCRYGKKLSSVLRLFACYETCCVTKCPYLSAFQLDLFWLRVHIEEFIPCTYTMRLKQQRVRFSICSKKRIRCLCFLNLILTLPKLFLPNCGTTMTFTKPDYFSHIFYPQPSYPLSKRESDLNGILIKLWNWRWNLFR